LAAFEFDPDPINYSPIGVGGMRKGLEAYDTAQLFGAFAERLHHCTH